MKRIQLIKNGFTLIELLIALVILGILVAIAYPSYLSYLHKSRRADAIATLTQDQIIFERCYSQNFSYSAACPARPTFPQASPQRFYTVAISNLTATTYTLTATPQGAQADDSDCAQIQINQANVKTASNTGGAANEECWNP